MNECWYAFTVALINHTYLTPESAFEFLNTGIKPRKKRHNKTIGQFDVIDMIEMKKTMTYKEIGHVYGMKEHAVYSRIRNYKKRNLLTRG